jgi:hypothetical protein
VNTADIRELSDDEIVEQISQAKEELFRLRFRSATQQLEKPGADQGSAPRHREDEDDPARAGDESWLICRTRASGAAARSVWASC